MRRSAAQARAVLLFLFGTMGAVARAQEPTRLLHKNVWLTADYHFVENPAYNRDRGPVHVFTLRLHTEF